MLTLPLEPTDDRAHPAFSDEESCTLWLDQLQLTNLQLAHSKLLNEISELNRYPMRGLDRLKTLDVLGEMVDHVQHDFSKKLIGKPLPLNENEFGIFQKIVQLWQAMITGYQRGLQSYISGEKRLQDSGALLCQRCLHYCGMEIFAYLHNGYEFSEQLWHQLHQLYAYAEQQNFHQIAINDTQGRHVTCASSYIRMLLACHANPAQLTRWQLQQMDRWLATWSSNLTISSSYSHSKNDAPPLGIDLSGKRGLQSVGNLPDVDSLRYLAMVPLSKLIRIKLILLQQGQTPIQAGLGDQLDSHDCIELLSLLHQYWCEKLKSRSSRRRHTTLDAQLCHDTDGIFAHLAAGATSSHHGIDHLAAKQIATLGQALSIRQEQAEVGYPLENWQMKNESILGAQLIRSDETGGRIACKQLIALRPCNSDYFMMGTIAWVSVTNEKGLEIGVKYFPARPMAIRIRSYGINPVHQEACAFLLPSIPSLNIPASLVLPLDWFRAKILIELQQPGMETKTVRLNLSIERGLNFERVSFTEIGKGLTERIGD